MPKGQGYIDAERGHTACPYGDEANIKRWNRDYDKAIKDGVAELPRFSNMKRKKK